MKWFRKIPEEIKNQILENIKTNWKSVPQMADEYNISTKTIYAWIKNDTEYKNPKSWWYSRSAILEINRLKKEKKDLISIIWSLTVVVEKVKKRDNSVKLRIKLTKEILSQIDIDYNSWEIFKKPSKSLICSVFGIHRSVLYNKSKMTKKDWILLQKIKDTLKIHPYYWYPRISLELWINKKCIYRIMQNNWLSAKQRQGELRSKRE